MLIPYLGGCSGVVTDWIQLHGAALVAAKKAGVKNVSVSISYTDKHAAAIATAQL